MADMAYDKLNLLIRDLRVWGGNQPGLAKDAADAIEALEAERDKWKNAALTNDAMAARQKDRAEKAEADLAAARAALQQCREAFEFTRQYVGYDVLPAIEGWSWFDADKAAEAAIAAARAEGGE